MVYVARLSPGGATSTIHTRISNGGLHLDVEILDELIANGWITESGIYIVAEPMDLGLGSPMLNGAIYAVNDKLEVSAGISDATSSSTPNLSTWPPK